MHKSNEAKSEANPLGYIQEGEGDRMTIGDFVGHTYALHQQPYLGVPST